MVSNTESTVAIIDLSAFCSDKQVVQQSALANFRIHGLTVLEWLVRRLSESTLLDQILITGARKFLPDVQACSLAEARWMPSPYEDPIRRAGDIANRTGAKWLLFASTSAPFIDAGLTDRLISTCWQNPDADYVAFVGRDRNDRGAQKLGLAGQVCSAAAIQKLIDQQTTNCSNAPSAVCSNLQSVEMKLLPLPNRLQNCEKNFVIHNAHDLGKIESFCESSAEDLSWQRLLQLAELTA